MYIDGFTSIFAAHGERTAIVWRDQPFSYDWLSARVSHWTRRLADERISPGTVVAVIGDFSPECLAIMLSLIENQAIIVPLNTSSPRDHPEKMAQSQAEIAVVIDAADASVVTTLGRRANHPLYADLRAQNAPGLVLFTSGTSGLPKGAVHHFPRLLEKFTVRRRALRTVNFLMFDHWGGLNTMFHTLSNAGTVLTTTDRSPSAICAFIERYRIELLPASPTFFNLLLMSEAYRHHDLSSLTVITYGTEPMPGATLKKLKSVFPNVKLQQTYGLIEVGVLRSQSKSDDSLWVKVGGDGYETRVVDGILQIKAAAAMLGYLNAPSPFTADGWFITGDSVEVDGEFIKILGRRSELINVGGEKVYPQEVENVILELANVRDVTVYGERNAIIGNIVCARVALHHPEEPKAFAARLKEHCADRLQRFMVPVRIAFDEPQHSERFKKVRKAT